MNLTFGRYMKNNSWFHKMDPRLKLFMSILLIISVFLNTGFVGYLVLLGCLLIFIILSRLPIRIFIRILKPVSFIISRSDLLKHSNASSDILLI